MTPEELSAAATVAGVAVAAAFGATGLVVGLVGLHHARQAKEAAAGANLIAKDANTIARGANTLSEESNVIAREANDISRRTADLGDEQHDADWQWEYDPDHEDMVTIQNIGKDRAVGTVIQFFFENVTEANAAPIDVEGRETIRFTIPTLRDAIVTERAERKEHERHYSGGGWGGRPSIYIPYVETPFRVRLRAKWRTALGAPKQYDSGWTTTYLPE